MKTHGATISAALVIVLCGSIATASYCDNIRERYSPAEKSLIINKRSKLLSLCWDSDPARAAAALFRTVAQDALGYQLVKLRTCPLDLSEFLKFAEKYMTKSIVLALSLAWKPTAAAMPAWTFNKCIKSGLPEYHLEDFGVSTIPTRLRLHVHIADNFRHLPECSDTALWSFYTNVTSLDHCGFISQSFSPEHSNLTVYKLSETEKNISLQDQVPLLDLRYEKLDRRNLLNWLQSGNHSFLFIDYDIWSGFPDVHAVQLPPCVPDLNSACQQELDNSVAMRVGKIKLLDILAPQLLVLAYNFTPSVKTIREILQLEADGKSIEEAACEFAWKHPNEVDLLVQKHNTNAFEALVFYCYDDPDFEEYSGLLKILNSEIQEQTKRANFTITFIGDGTNCSNANDLKDKLLSFTSFQVIRRYIGAIVGRMDGIPIAIEALASSRLPIILYDAVAINGDSGASTWVASGRTVHLALALQHTVLMMQLTRVVILSEDTIVAKQLVHNLRGVGGVALQEYTIPLHLSNTTAKDILQVLQNALDGNTQIVFVNTNSKDAATILHEALNLGMNSSEDYAWIVREWQPNNITSNIKHFTMSFWCQRGMDVISNEGRSDIREKMDGFWPNRMWPAQAAALANAALTLVSAFESVILKNPDIRNNIHDSTVIRLLETALNNEPVKGIVQNLTYKDRLLEEAVIFVDEWNGAQRKLLQRWRVNATASTVMAVPYAHSPFFISLYSQKNKGDSTSWYIVFILVPCVILIAYCTWRHFLKQQAMRAHQLQEAYSVVAEYKVNRSSLELRHELYTGRFASVRLVLLRMPGRRPQFSAAKIDKRYKHKICMLKEASTLASLDHDHIIRLIGVCVDEGSLLMLIDLAFYGNLLQYLRTRQYLAKSAVPEVAIYSEEATYVSAEALTRLALQAALALEYLSLRGIIHRNLHAVNCLVDASRSLKLTGFDVACNMNVEDTPEPSQQRKQLESIPVQVLAPESLDGVFSTASDIWACGVLMYELVTMGARPYGDKSPLFIKEFVKTGGNPQLPYGASPETNHLAQLCWRRDPEQRPTAAELVTYLTEHPGTLCPAFDPDQSS